MKGRLKRAAFVGRAVYEHYVGRNWHRLLISRSFFDQAEWAKDATPAEVAAYGFPSPDSEHPAWHPIFLKPSPILSDLDRNTEGEWRICFRVCGCSDRCSHDTPYATVFFELADDYLLFKLKGGEWEDAEKRFEELRRERAIELERGAKLREAAAIRNGWKR